MNATALGIIFGPTLFGSDENDSNNFEIECKLVEIIISCYVIIFEE